MNISHFEAFLGTVPKQPVTRFAPSPTGYLHLGHVMSMAFVFGIAALVGAKILLRIEDHDGERCRKEYEKAILDDMAWLGFIPANWNEFSLAKSDFRQSDCFDIYDAALESLSRRGKLYFCECSRKHLIEGQESNELSYPGTCRFKNLVDGSKCGVRFVVDDHQESFHDIYLGAVKQNPFQQCGDFLLKDKRGYFTYNFAVVLDDLRHGVNFIIRGEDILHCTGRQLALAHCFESSWKPAYLHHPLALDPEGKKLSKRIFSEGIIQRRLSGELPENIIGEALFHAGILSSKIPVRADEVENFLRTAWC